MEKTVGVRGLLSQSFMTFIYSDYSDGSRSLLFLRSFAHYEAAWSRTAAKRRSTQEAVMAKRERFVTSVTCPECALNGSAMWEEHESGNLETTIKSLSRGFRIGPDNEVLCADCGVKARIVGIASDTKLAHSSPSG
jgi:hypothetical protein